MINFPKLLLFLNLKFGSIKVIYCSFQDAKCATKIGVNVSNIMY